MNYKEFYMPLNVRDNNVKLLDGVVRGDTAVIVNATLIDGDEPFDFTGYSDIMMSIEGPNSILIKSIVTSKEEYNTENPYNIHVASAKDGRLSFNPHGLATSEEGTYYVRFILFSGSDILATARVNYHVSRSDKNLPLSAYVNTSEYAGLVNLTSQISGYVDAELARVLAESWRKANEEARQEAEEERKATVEEMTNAWEDFQDTVSSVEEYAKSAAESAEIAKHPTIEAISAILAGMNLPSDKNEMGELVSEYIGEYLSNGIDGDDITISIKMSDDIGSLAPGEMALDSSDFNLYIGTEGGNICLTEHVRAANTAPANTNLLWIDKSLTSSLLKYYDGTSWTAVKTAAVFG